MGGVIVTQNPGLSEDLKAGVIEISINRRGRRERRGKTFQNDLISFSFFLPFFLYSAFSAPSAVNFF